MSDEIVLKKPAVSRFSWKLAEMTERHNAIRDSGTTSTDVLGKIHRIYDPGHKKSLERLLKSYSESS